MLRAFRLIVVLLVALVTGGIPGVVTAQIATPASRPATPVAGAGNGSLLAAMDPSVPAGKDFYRYLESGKFKEWVAQTLAGKQPDVKPGPPLPGGPTVVLDTPPTARQP